MLQWKLLKRCHRHNLKTQQKVVPMTKKRQMKIPRPMILVCSVTFLTLVMLFSSRVGIIGFFLFFYLSIPDLSNETPVQEFLIGLIGYITCIFNACANFAANRAMQLDAVACRSPRCFIAHPRPHLSAHNITSTGHRHFCISKLPVVSSIL